MASNYGERFGGMRNFLATDEVPKTLFGVPIVSNPDEYTDADLAFFRKNPEAGGYYDLGSEDPWDATPDDGTAEGAPVQNRDGGKAIKYVREKAALVDPSEIPELEPVPELAGADLSAWSVVLPNNEQDERVAKKATLKHSDVTPVFVRDEKTNKVTGYATTESLIVKDWSRKGRGFYAVVPTVFKDDKTGKVSRHNDKEALERYRRTGDSWGGFYDIRHADKVAQAVHQNHQAKFRRDWNAYTFTAPESELGDNILRDPGVQYFRGLVDRAYDTIRPEENWDKVSVPVGGKGAYRIGPGLLGTYYVAQPDSLRREQRVLRGMTMDPDSPEGVYAAKNYIANLLLAHTKNGRRSRLLGDIERPYDDMQLTALSLGYHGGPSVVLDHRLLAAETDEGMRKALAGILLDKVNDNGIPYAALGRRMREYERMTGVPGSGPELANYTDNPKLKARIKALSGDGPGSYRDSPAYKGPKKAAGKKTTQRKGR